jgi:hypothetical protein
VTSVWALQTFGFIAIALAFFLLWAIPAATTDVALFLIPSRRPVSFF